MYMNIHVCIHIKKNMGSKEHRFHRQNPVARRHMMAAMFSTSVQIASLADMSFTCQSELGSVRAYQPPSRFIDHLICWRFTFGRGGSPWVEEVG